MSRFLAPLLIILATSAPALAGGIVFDLPRLDFPTPQAPVASDSVATKGQ